MTVILYSNNCKVLYSYLHCGLIILYDIHLVLKTGHLGLQIPESCCILDVMFAKKEKHSNVILRNIRISR